MKQKMLIALLMTTLASAAQPLSLQYSQPATEWAEALPVGNGRLGGMIFGDPQREHIQFNEDSLWTGQPQDYQLRGAAKFLPELRRLLFAGQQDEAEELANEHFMSVPLRQEFYQPFGDLSLEFDDLGTVTEYRRSLDLKTAISSVTFVANGVRHRRELFASYPDGVMVLSLTTDQPGKLNFKAQLNSPHTEHQLKRLYQDTLVLAGQVTHQSRTKVPSRMRFEARLQVLEHNGQLVINGKDLCITQADQVTLVLSAATSYYRYYDISADPEDRNELILKGLTDHNLASLYDRHVQDYQSLFNRVTLDLGQSENMKLDTDQRIAAFKEGHDPHLASLFFQYGRYLLISCSRPGSQPANLQGLWNDQMNPSWGSKYTCNINTEMNYWPAEMTNLAECHEPLFAMIKDLSATGYHTAQNFYNADGWVLHHNTDLWRGTAPINNANHGIWVTGGAWLCQHLWWHYAYSQDEFFLREQAYPIMKQAAEFFMDFLIEDPRSEQGWLISGPSNSPENGGLVMGPTMDHQIIRNLFAHCIEASEILGIDPDFRAQLADMRSRIAPNQIGQYGQLQEWLEDKDNPKSDHRHVSHLWGLHPGNEITPATPDLFAAARKSLELRGDGGTGWSMAWKINFWARLRDGDHAYLMLSNQLTPQRTLPNLFDTHPPFQIDGNFGATSGITEMLMQSHTGTIDLLPALPSAWPMGKVEGLRARGGFEVGLDWNQNRLTTVSIVSKAGRPCRLQYGDQTLQFATETGRLYRIVFNPVTEKLEVLP